MVNNFFRKEKSVQARKKTFQQQKYWQKEKKYPTIFFLRRRKTNLRYKNMTNKFCYRAKKNFGKKPLVGKKNCEVFWGQQFFLASVLFSR